MDKKHKYKTKYLESQQGGSPSSIKSNVANYVQSKSGPTIQKKLTQLQAVNMPSLIRELNKTIVNILTEYRCCSSDIKAILIRTKKTTLSNKFFTALDNSFSENDKLIDQTFKGELSLPSPPEKSAIIKLSEIATYLTQNYEKVINKIFDTYSIFIDKFKMELDQKKIPMIDYLMNPRETKSCNDTNNPYFSVQRNCYVVIAGNAFTKITLAIKEIGRLIEKWKSYVPTDQYIMFNDFKTNLDKKLTKIQIRYGQIEDKNKQNLVNIMNSVYKKPHKKNRNTNRLD